MSTFTWSPRPTNRNELSAWYESVLLEQERTGLSVTEAAEEVGVTPVTLYAWRRRLRGWIDNEENEADEAPTQLIRVHLRTNEEAERTSMPFVLRLGGDRVVEVPSGFDAKELARLIEVVSEC